MFSIVGSMHAMRHVLHCLSTFDVQVGSTMCVSNIYGIHQVDPDN